MRHDARLRVRAAAWLLAGLTVCALVATPVLLALKASRVDPDRIGADALLAAEIWLRPIR